MLTEGEGVLFFFPSDGLQPSSDGLPPRVVWAPDQLRVSRPHSLNFTRSRPSGIGAQSRLLVTMNQAVSCKPWKIRLGAHQWVRGVQNAKT